MIAMNKKGQEEMVGFGVIIVIVMIILMVFISISIRKNSSPEIQSYEINSFIQSFLQYSTSCQNYFGEASVQDLIYLCERNTECLNGQNSCDVLDSTMGRIVSNSWVISNESAYKGYNLQISSGKNMIFRKFEGLVTNNYKGGLQDLPPKQGQMIKVLFNLYV